MRLLAPAVIALLVAASSPAAPAGEPIDLDLKRAIAEQKAAEARTAQLERLAAGARSEAERLRAEQAAAAEAIGAAEARISAADARFRLASAYVAAHRQRLAQEQRPVSSLLAGLALMSQRPPLLVLADRGGTDELVKVRILLDSTLPVIRARTAGISAQIAEGRRLEQSALSARGEVEASRQALVGRREQFAALERKALEQAFAAGGQALSAGDVAISAGEDVERLRGAELGSRFAREVAARLAAEAVAPARPFAPDGAAPRPPFRYQLPALAPVTEGLGAVNDSGVRSRGLALATARGTPISAPADGIIRFAGPFRDYDGVLIIDHGRGWMSLVVNVGTDRAKGANVRIGQPIGRALGPLSVELSQNGRRISPALIAGSSQNLSKSDKGG